MILRKNEQLLINRELPPEITNELILEDNNNFLENLTNNAFLQRGRQITHLPDTTPFELHPYKNLMQLGQFEKYIIGTFPPISYVYDLLENIDIIRQPLNANNRKIPKPGFPFYHGNKKLMWDYLLTEDEQEEMPVQRIDIRNYLIEKLHEININYADIIDSTQRRLLENRYKGSDNLLYNLTINLDLIQHILSNKQCKYLLFNTASIYGIAGINLIDGYIDLEEDAKSFDLYVRALQELGYIIQIRLHNGINHDLFFQWTNISDLNLQQRSTKIAFELKVINPVDNPSDFCNTFEAGSYKEFIVITPFSPAVAQRVNLLAGNPTVASWLQLNPNSDTRDMLFQIYQNFRLGNWNTLFEMNQ